jgi:acyl carrier protein
MTNRQETDRRIRKVLIESLSLGLREEDLPYSDTLDEWVALDSMAALQFVIGLEKEFGVVIEPEQLELALLKDLPRLRDYIARRTG